MGDSRWAAGRLDREELLDQPGQTPEDVSASLRDVRLVNRFLAGTAVTQGHLWRLLRKQRKDIPYSVLDVATGSGDIPRAISRFASRKGYCLHWTCLDFSPAVLQVAKAESRDFPQMDWVQGDARNLAFPDGSFDYVTCSMALHHFGPEDAAQILSEMDRVARRGWVLNDLRRSRVAWVLIWLLTHILGANRLTRHDGPVSTLRAYTPNELNRLVSEAGLKPGKVFTHLFYRMALMVEKPEAGA